MNGLSGRGAVRELTAAEVADGLAAGRIVLVDVREPAETAVERIPGAVLIPLSQFDPRTCRIRAAAPWCFRAPAAFARPRRVRSHKRRGFHTIRIWRAG
jgi:hypothetical protein